MGFFYFPWCDKGVDVCCLDFGKKLLNLVHGVGRLLVFMCALMPLVTMAFVFKSNILTYASTYGAAVGAFLTTWSIIRMAMEVCVCLIVMADTIVSTDSPFGFNVNDFTFLYLSKIPPSVVRGALWLLLSGFSSKEVLEFFSTNYQASIFAFAAIILDTGRKLLIIPGTFWLIYNLVRFHLTLFTLEVGLVPITTKRLDGNHWRMTRYYEKKAWYEHLKKQRIKHRIDKILFLFSPLVALISHTFKFYLDYSVIASSSPSSGILFTSSVSTNVAYTLVSALYYIDLIVPYLAHLFVSILIVVYLVILLIKSKFTPFHWMVKALILYNLISTMASESTLTSITTRVFNSSISPTVALWISACIPFVIFLPTIPYVLTRSPAMYMREISGIFKNFLQLCLNFLNPSKLYRVFHVFTIIFGVCGFLLLMLGIPLSWMSVDFNLNVDMTALKAFHTTLDAKIGSIETTFANVLGPLSCVPIGDTIDNKATLDQLKADHPLCFLGITQFEPSYCPDIRKAHNGAVSTTQYDSACISKDTVCIVFMAMIIAGFVLATTPFAGSAGKIMVMAARTVKKLYELTNTLGKVRSKVVTYKRLLTNFLKVLQKVTMAVAFALVGEYLLILLPCVALGAICLSIGFWKRESITGVFSRSMLTFISIGFVVTNIPIGLFVWFAAPLLQGVLDIAPLFDVTVTEQIGWQMIKIAYVCSSIAAVLMWIYSTGDFILAMMTRLFCGCTCCGKCTQKCRRYAEFEDVETDTSNPDAAINEGMETEDTRNIGTTDSDGVVGETDGDVNLEYAEGTPDNVALVEVETTQPVDDTATVSEEDKEKVVKSLILTEIASPSAWFMPLVPALFAGLLIAYVIVYQPSMYIIYTRINGETSSLESEISIGSERMSDGADTMNEEKTLCDLITAAVTAPFMDLFNALTPSIITDYVIGFVTKMKSVFSIPISVSLSGWAHFIFTALPGLACFLFIVGFVLTIVPCCSRFTKGLILSQIKQSILVILLASLSFSLTASMAIQRFLETLPLIEITAHYGLAIQFSLLANFILLLAWVELSISEYAPIV